MTDSIQGAAATAQTNLPLQLTSFIGREREQAEVQRLLATARLLTLTGPPGCGKTRLALETGHAALAQYPDGVWLVDLTQTSDPAALPRLAAQALGLVILGDTDVEKAVIDYLYPRRLLMIFDNCEHVLDAAARLCQSILSACPRVQILATSQAPLGIPGEQEWLVPSLPLPEAAEPIPEVEALRRYDAVRLFEERAAATLPEFQLNDENAPSVVEICRRLDGIPLAIELAAARVKMFSAQEIAARLDHRFDLLAAPRRRAPSRHQTLRSAIDWSYNLLPAGEQALLCRLSVFTGSFSLDAAAQICGYDPLDPAEVSRSLAEPVDRSLVVVDRREGPETRYRLLDSIRQYGLARLTEEEQALLKDRHLDFFTRLAKRFDQNQWGASQIEWLDRLEADWPNIRAAIGWVLSSINEARLFHGLSLSEDLLWYFRWRNHIQEPATWLADMLPRAENLADPNWLAARAKAHFSSGLLYVTDQYGSQEGRMQMEISQALWAKLGAHGRRGYAWSTMFLSQWDHWDFAITRTNLEECREIFASQPDPVGTAWLMYNEGGLAERMSAFAVAEKKYRELLSFASRLQSPFFNGLALMSLHRLMNTTHRYAESMQYGVKAIEVFQHLGAQRWLLMTYISIVETRVALGNLEQAEALTGEIEEIQERMDIYFTRADNSHNRGEIYLLKGQFEAAAGFFRQSSRAHYQGHFLEGFFAGSMGLAAAVAEQDPEQAARIYGFARKAAGGLQEGMYHENSQAVATERLNIARRLLGEAAFERALVEGASGSLDEVIPAEEDAALPTTAAPRITISPRRVEQARFSGLTRREREIAARIAQGMSNPAIAQALTISERTVTTHVTNILAKLGFSSRTQIAAWAAEKGLASP